MQRIFDYMLIQFKIQYQNKVHYLFKITVIKLRYLTKYYQENYYNSELNKIRSVRKHREKSEDTQLDKYNIPNIAPKKIKTESLFIFILKRQIGSLGEMIAGGSLMVSLIYLFIR